MIDVSQAVDLDHPKALDFLREDIGHVNDFFRRSGAFSPVPSVPFARHGRTQASTPCNDRANKSACSLRMSGALRCRGRRVSSTRCLGVPQAADLVSSWGGEDLADRSRRTVPQHGLPVL